MTPIDMVDGRLPLPLGGGGGQAIPASDVDVQIENLPFWLQIDKQAPYQRQTAQYKKDQVDQAPQAGEQSLASWWIRSQMSFHFGAGQRYLDTDIANDPVAHARFRDSRGVNVWTPGVVTRLNGTLLADPISGSSKAYAATALIAGVETFITAHGTTVRTYNGTSWSTLTYGSAQPILGFAQDGTNYYTLTSDGVYKQPISGGSAAVKIYTVGAGVTSGALGWVKDRLMAAINNIIYQLDCNAAASSALPTMTYTHPNAAWTFVCFCETPSGIGVAGSAGLLSTIMQLKLEQASGGAPVLDSAVLLLTMPEGELINDAFLHIGSMLVLATSRGVRVSTFQSYFGTITLGPNVILDGDGVAVPCYSLAGYDRYVFAGTQFDNKPALMRVDIGSVEDQAGHYPWAPDLLPPAGSSPSSSSLVTAIAVRQDGTKWFAATGYGVIGEESAPDLAQPAWLQTSRIRLGTVEDKHWVHGAVRGVLSGSAPIAVETQGPGTAWTAAYSAQVNGDAFGLQQAKGEWLALRLTLTGANELNSYQVQALPAGKRQRILSIPLAIADYQVTRSGVGVGYDGWAGERLEALEELEQSGAIITLAAPALFPQAVRGVIEQITYVQEQDPGDRGAGTGGRVVVQLRTVQ